MKVLTLVLGVSLAALPSMADVVYSSMPSPIPGNVVSQCYECAEVAEIGQGVQLAGDQPATLGSATVLMSDWALKSDWQTYGTATGYDVPLTLNLYQVGANNTVGSLITSETIDAFIQYRPEASAACDATHPGDWQAADGNCYAGLAQTVTFNLNNVAVPGQFIWGLALNTTNWGYTPTGVQGPYDSLNVGLNSNPDGVNPYTPAVGSDLVPGSIYWNTLYGPYTDGPGDTGVFTLNSNWAPYDPAITFSSSNPTPEPSFLLLVGAGFAGIFIVRYKFRRHAV